MTDKEKLEAIRAEIHRLVDVRGYDREMANDLFAFMDSLPNEPVSEDLEEEIDNYIKRNGYDGLDSIEEVKYIAQYFTKWQKEQMMAKAVDGKVIANGMGNPILHLWDKGRHLIGKKVKVIVIKED